MSNHNRETTLAKQPKLNREAPIFVVGVQRSGTTLLRVMLTSHPAICMPPECALYKLLAGRWGKEPHIEKHLDAFLEDLFGVKHFDAWNLEKEEIREVLAAAAPCDYPGALFEICSLHARKAKPAAQRWGIKNPNGILHMETIFEFFPEARILHIVRDVRAVYGSEKRKRTANGRFDMRNTLWRCARLWKEADAVIRQFEKDPRVYTLYYEDLVKETQNTLQGICKWLDLPWAEEMKYYYKVNRDQQLVPNDRKWQQVLTFEPPNPDRVEAWQEELQPAEIMALEYFSEVFLKERGYEVNSTPLQRVLVWPSVSRVFLRRLWLKVTGRT